MSTMKLKISEYLDIFSSCLYRPRKQFTMPFDSGMCTRDTAYQKEMDDDFREHRLATSKLLVETAAMQFKALILKKHIASPVLFLLAGEDKLVDVKMSEKVFEGLKTRDKEINVYPGMYHALSIELDKENVFMDIFNWIEERL